MNLCLLLSNHESRYKSMSFLLLYKDSKVSSTDFALFIRPKQYCEKGCHQQIVLHWILIHWASH